MTTQQWSRRGFTLAGLASLTACAVPMASGPGEAPLQRADALLRRSDPGWNIALKLVPNELRLGQPLTAEIASAMPGFVYLFLIGTEGKSLEMIFPNPYDGANAMSPGTLMLPRPTWRMRATGPAGVGYYLAVVAAQNQDLFALMAQAKDPAQTLAVSGSFGAAMASVREA